MQGVDFFLSALDEGGERGSHSRTCFFPPRLKDGQSVHCTLSYSCRSQLVVGQQQAVFWGSLIPCRSQFPFMKCAHLIISAELVSMPVYVFVLNIWMIVYALVYFYNMIHRLLILVRSICYMLFLLCCFCKSLCFSQLCFCCCIQCSAFNNVLVAVA